MIKKLIEIYKNELRLDSGLKICGSLRFDLKLDKMNLIRISESLLLFPILFRHDWKLKISFSISRQFVKKWDRVKEK